MLYTCKGREQKSTPLKWGIFVGYLTLKGEPFSPVRKRKATLNKTDDGYPDSEATQKDANYKKRGE